MTEEEKQEALIKNQAQQAKQRAAMPKEVKQFCQINQKHKIRNLRREQNGKEHLLENQKAKKGMKVLREEGSLKDFTPRSKCRGIKICITGMNLENRINPMLTYSKKRSLILSAN